MTQAKAKHVVGLGGTLRPNSSTECTVRRVLEHASARGATVEMFGGADVHLPMYSPGCGNTPASAQKLIAALRCADAIVIGSPGYHGCISGLVKNALDYVEEMAADAKPYFTGRAIGCVATGAGWQGANATLHALRNVAHALRGWPTSLGVALNSREPLFDSNGVPLHPEVDAQLKALAEQLAGFQGATS